MPAEIPADVVAAVREVLVAAKRDAGPRAVLFTNHVIDRAARPIARLLVRLVEDAVERRLAEQPPNSAGVGWCGAQLKVGGIRVNVCDLTYGHAGGHRANDGARWMETA